MSTTASFYVEYLTDGTWVYDPDGFGQAGCSGWWALLGLQSATSAEGVEFPGIATRGFPDDMAEETIAALLRGFHLVDNTNDSGWSGWTEDMPRLSLDENTSLAWFTLADLHAIIDLDADFVTERHGYTKAETLDSARTVLERAEQRAANTGTPAEHVRFIVALD